MKVNKNIFRGYDLRGLVGDDLSEELAEHLGRTYGTYLRRHDISEAVVGYDCRATSPAYAEALVRGLTAVGVAVTNIGLVMIGTFYWSQYHLKRKGGVYVSASHNPPQFNGFKFAIDYSETLVSDGMQELRRMVEEDDFELVDVPASSTIVDVKEAYMSDLLKRLTVSKKIKVVVDPGNTTAGTIVPDLLRRAGCEVVEYNTDVDPTFPLGTADPTEVVVAERLGREVREAVADLGFTYDADGDRIGVVDENGGIIWNDILVALFAAEVLREHAGATIMYNTLCSKVVPETIAAHGGSPFMWRTGHSFLKKKNQEVKAAFIGELSGHFFFSADFYNHDDGCYSTLRLLQYLTSSGKKLSEVVAALPLYLSSPEIKVYTDDAQKVDVVQRISEQLKKDYPQAEVIEDERAGDGIRLELPEQMFVVRYSQNGPYLTIKYEAKTDVQYNELRKYIGDLLHTFPEIDWESEINVNVESLL